LYEFVKQDWLRVALLELGIDVAEVGIKVVVEVVVEDGVEFVVEVVNGWTVEVFI